MTDCFKTLAAASEASFVERRSKFLSFAIPLRDVGEVKALLSEYKRKYHDARHICYAYAFGAERETAIANDNGEPSGTAGRPMLEQIVSFGITNVLVVVVRYFGGVKLGTSGLFAAYREAARRALQSAEIIEETVKQRVVVSFSYALADKVLRIVRSSTATIAGKTFDLACKLALDVRLSEADSLKERLLAIKGVKIVDEQ